MSVERGCDFLVRVKRRLLVDIQRASSVLFDSTTSGSITISANVWLISNVVRLFLVVIVVVFKCFLFEYTYASTASAASGCLMCRRCAAAVERRRIERIYLVEGKRGGGRKRRGEYGRGRLALGLVGLVGLGRVAVATGAGVLAMVMLFAARQ